MWSEQLTENQLAEALAENGDIRFQNWCFNRDYQREKTQQIFDRTLLPIMSNIMIS